MRLSAQHKCKVPIHPGEANQGGDQGEAKSARHPVGVARIRLLLGPRSGPAIAVGVDLLGWDFGRSRWATPMPRSLGALGPIYRSPGHVSYQEGEKGDRNETEGTDQAIKQRKSQRNTHLAVVLEICATLNQQLCDRSLYLQQAGIRLIGRHLQRSRGSGLALFCPSLVYCQLMFFHAS